MVYDSVEAAIDVAGVGGVVAVSQAAVDVAGVGGVEMAGGDSPQ